VRSLVATLHSAMQEITDKHIICALPFLMAFTFCESRPIGMVKIPGGTFYRGLQFSGRPDQVPRHRVKIRSFYLDETLVTVADFRKFVEKTGYRTSAERIGYTMISFEGMADWKWQPAKGASWRNPFGDIRIVPVHEDDPVTAVSWEDANQYCSAIGNRLPTEAEWEYAARAGSDLRFPWGDSPLRNGVFGLNFWQPEHHEQGSLEDGFLYISSVRAYPPNAWGMYDPVGNVWQFTSDYYSPFTYQDSAEEANQNPDHMIVDTKGPDHGYERVARGGSWWCSENTCNGFGLYYRGHTAPVAPFNNQGFRCAKDLGTN